MEQIQDLTGQTLGHYKIIEQIGQGGMATVFKAYQSSLSRYVAIKVLPLYIAQKEGFTERFSREAQAIGNLHHPNILPVHDFGQDKGYGYIVMRYVAKARTLADLMKESLTPAQISHVISQVADALDHAHRAGIVHRDIKPSNILLDGEWVLLSDFGLAKIMTAPSELTGTGVGIGTPAYMSPEQAKAEPVDFRTDIYALGIILYEMLTGQVPHKAETPLATVLKRINEPLTPPRQLNPDISPAVEEVLLTALADDPAQRFDSAGEMATALRTALAKKSTPELTEPVEGRRISTHISPPRPIQPSPPEAVSTPAPPSRPQIPASVEIVILTLLAITSLCGIGGVLLSFMPDSDTGELDLTLSPVCLGMAFAGFSSMALVWGRKRDIPASAWLAIGIIAWFIGVNILGWGGFAVLSPGDNTFAENLGFSMALCFVPGGFLTLLGLGLYLYDRRRAGRMRTEVAHQEKGPGKSQSRYEDKLERAAEYRLHITDLLKAKRGTALARQLAPIADKLEAWEVHLGQLVNRLNAFETNQIIQRDLREVPVAIANLEAQLETEANSQVRAEMAETLARQRTHQEQLNSLVTMMRRTELDIDETMAAVGAIYSQLQLLGAKEIDTGRAKRLSAEVEEQAHRLGDLLSAMDEVYDVTTDD